MYNTQEEINNKKIGIGIIGTGSISGHHIKCVRELPNCELIAVASSSVARAEAAQEKYHVEAYSDYNVMLLNKDIHAIIICTQSGNHLLPALAAAKEGKHLLIEKPLEVSIERAQKIVAVCRENNVKLSCIFQNRFSQDFIKLKETVSSGALGKIIMANAYIQWFRQEEYYSSSSWKGTLSGDGGASFINQGIHTIDLLLDLAGDVESVFAKTKTVTHKIEGEDLGVALISFSNGALGTIHASTALWPGYPERIEIFGTEGSIFLEAGKITKWNIKNEDITKPDLSVDTSSGSSDPMAISHELHKAQINDFVWSIINNTEPAITGEEGMKALELILKIYESSESEKVIYY